MPKEKVRINKSVVNENAIFVKGMEMKVKETTLTITCMDELLIE